MATSILAQLTPVFGNAPASPLAALVAVLRAVYQTHQGAHWQTRTQTYYADHLLFQRLYDKLPEEIDSVAERTVGNGGVALLDPAKQAAQTLDVVASVRGKKTSLRSPQELVEISFAAEMFLLQVIDEILTTTRVSQGTQNLLQGIADAHEGNVYLLQQRLAQG